MPEVSPWRWVPESALPQVARRFDDLLQPWARSWGLAPGAGQATLARADILFTHDAKGTWTSLSGEGGPWIRLPPSLTEDLAAGMFGQEATRSQLAPEVAQRAVQALQAHLQQTLGDTQPPSKRPPPLGEGGGGGAASRAQAFPEIGHWGVQCELPLGTQGIALLSTSSWLLAQGWIDRPSPPPLKPHDWSTTLASLPVAIRVDLGDAAVSVGDLFNLGEGDVILMSQPIAQALPVHVVGSDVQLRAHLGQSASRRAVQFISTPAAGTQT